MNWLAHVSLSPHTAPQQQLGNLVADLVKGRVWDGASSGVIQGLADHQRIDLFTDAQPVVKRSRMRLGEKGRLRGVALDIVYDHFLTRHWESFFPEPLSVFSERFYKQVRGIVQESPQEVQSFVLKLVSYDYLRAYTEPLDVLESFYRMDRRLSERLRKVELVSSYFPAFEKNYEGIEEDFLEFFPQLMKHVEARD